MTPEQRDVTRNALRKYGERHWARTPENRRWQSAIDEGIDYYQAHDPMRADLLRMRFFEQRPEDEILEQLHIGRTCAVGGGIEGAAVVVQARVGGNGVDRLAVNEHIHALVRRSGTHADAYGQAQHRQRCQQSQQSAAVGRLSLLSAKKG